MNKKIPFPLAILIILLVIAVIIVVAFWLCPKEKTTPSQEKTTDWKACATDSDCVVFGKDGDCNCGCFNKNYTDWQAGGICFCAAPTSCGCINSRCEGVFLEDKTADWQTYRNEEYEFEFKYPADWEIIEDYFYETAAGVAAARKTITLAEVGEADSNNWVHINPRQFQAQFGECSTIADTSVCTYSKDQRILDIYNQMFSTFRFTGPVETCVDNCGNGICEEVVCLAIGCPCAETEESCPEDCGIETEIIQLEIQDFTTDKETYASNEELRASLMILTSGDIEGAVVNLVGIKPSNYAYINSSQIIDLISGENEIIFTATTPHCTSGCGGVYPGPYDLSAEVFIEDNLIVSSTISINLTNN